ncbi:MAG: PDZ domain-containing protein [Phycisphaerales bacterium]|nr:PDZ domain-containing protein [Phycisphaerales bacterium]
MVRLANSGRALAMNLLALAPSRLLANGAVGLALAAAVGAGTNMAAAGLASGASLPQIQARYQQVLSAVRSPSADGALIVSQNLSEPLTTAGLEPGEVILSIDGIRIAGPADIARIVAQVSPRRKVSLRVAGNLKIFVARVAAGALHVETLGVVAGVPGPRNPPSTPRRNLVMHWRETPGGESVMGVGFGGWYRVIDHGYLIGTLHLAAGRAGDDWQLHWRLRIYQSVLPADIAPIRWRSGCYRVDFWSGDNQRLPAFSLRGITAQSLDGRKAVWTLHDRAGRLTAKITRSLHSRPVPPVTVGTSPMAIAEVALPLVADAMPHKANLVLRSPVLTLPGLYTRLGCVLVTRGRCGVTIGGAIEKAWRVDLLYLQQRQMTFWFDDHRQLLEANLGGSRTIVRTVNRQAAEHGLPPSHR